MGMEYTRTLCTSAYQCQCMCILTSVSSTCTTEVASIPFIYYGQIIISMPYASCTQKMCCRVRDREWAVPVLQVSWLQAGSDSAETENNGQGRG